MLQALQLKDPIQEAPYRFLAQGLAILTGVFLVSVSPLPVNSTK
jgi:hypothetical protein